MQRVPEMFSTSTARPRNGVSHSRRRLSLLEQVMLGPFQPRSWALAVRLAKAPVKVIRPKPESSRAVRSIVSSLVQEGAWRLFSRALT